MPFFREVCRQDPDFLNQVLALERILRMRTSTESASLSALSLPVARSLGGSLARGGGGENLLEPAVLVFNVFTLDEPTLHL